MSLAATKQDLYDCFAEDETGRPVVELASVEYGGLGHVRRVMRGEPRAGDLPAPISMSVITTGMGATEYRFAVNIYAKPDLDALFVQDQLDQTIDAAEALFTSEFTRGDWVLSFNQGIDAFVASCPTIAVRTD